MKMGRRRRPSLPADCLDEDVWQRLAGVLTAANRGGGSTFVKLLQRFDDWRGQSRDEAALYLAYLLRYRVAEILAGRPTAEDLHELAFKTYPKVCEGCHGARRHPGRHIARGVLNAAYWSGAVRSQAVRIRHRHRWGAIQ